MEYKIEKMNKMRRNSVLGLLFGTVISFVLVLFSMNANLYLKFKLYKLFKLPWSAWKGRIIFGRISLLILLLTFFIFFMRYLHYKRKLFKNPALRVAVDDERVRMSWLKAFRFSSIWSFKPGLGSITANRE